LLARACSSLVPLVRLALSKHSLRQSRIGLGGSAKRSIGRRLPSRRGFWSGLRFDLLFCLRSRTRTQLRRLLLPSSFDVDNYYFVGLFTALASSNQDSPFQLQSMVLADRAIGKTASRDSLLSLHSLQCCPVAFTGTLRNSRSVTSRSTEST